MKYLLYAGILGFSFWMVSEIIEIINGYNTAVYFLTSGYHLLAGVGIWGLYKVQSHDKNKLGKIGAIIALIGYLGVVYFPIGVMNSGLNISEFLDINPIYKVFGGFWFLGMILFGISLTKTKYFPLWTAMVFITGTLIFTATPLLGLPTILANCTNIIFSLTVIYMCVFGLNKFNNNH